MEGAKHIKDITGEWPVYPGHPLTVAWEIMAIFPGPADALALVTENGLNCPAAVADIRISGAGGEVNSACHLLRMARSGKSAEVLIQWADQRWTEGNAGGHKSSVAPGLAQAEKLKPMFADKLTSWLAAEVTS